MADSAKEAKKKQAEDVLRDLQSALYQVEHGKQTARTAAVKEVKSFFDGSHEIKNIHIISDKSYHKLVEDIFRIVLNEKSTILKLKPGTKATKTSAETRLTVCAEAILVMIQVGASKLRKKTVEALVDHITQTLPLFDGTYFEPLITPYLKALCALAEQPAIVERLDQERWFAVVDFCLEIINWFLDHNERDPSGMLSRNSSGLGSRASPAPGSMSKSSMSNSYAQKHDISLTQKNLEDLFETLLLFTSDPASPIFERYSNLGDTVLRYLLWHGLKVEKVYQLAFSILNSVLSYTRLDRSSYSQALAQNTLPIIYRFWQGKRVSKDELLNSIRDEMFIFLINIHPHLAKALLDDKTDDLRSLLEALLDALRADYTRRSDRDQLQLDDLDMIDFGFEPLDTTPFNLHAFKLKAHCLRGERNWGLLQIVGLLERLVSQGHGKLNLASSDEMDIDPHPNKRQRTIQSADRLLDPLKSGDESTRRAALQTLPFVLQEIEFPETSLVAVLAKLRQYAGDKRGNIGSWALLAMASCTYQTAARNIDSSEWMQLWHIGTRSLTFPATCRAASVQVHALLAQKLLQYHDIADDVESMISSADGPAILCESSICLMAHLLNARVTEVPGASLPSSQHVIRWLFARWNPVDKYFSTHYAVHFHPHHVTNLIRVSLGLSRISLPVIATLPCGPIAQAWQNHLNTWDTLHYILLLNDANAKEVSVCSSCPKSFVAGTTADVLNTSHFNSARKLVLELLDPRCSSILEEWRSNIGDGTSTLATDLFRSILNSCLAMLMLMPHFSDAKGDQATSIQGALEELSREVVDFLNDPRSKDHSGNEAAKETLLQSIYLYLPPCGSASFRLLLNQKNILTEFFILVADQVSRTGSVRSNPSAKGDFDEMDIDDDFSFGRKQAKLDTQKPFLPRKTLSHELWSGTFFRTILGRLSLVAGMSATPDDTPHVPHSFVVYVEHLTEEELVSSRQLLRELYQAHFTFDDSDAERLTKKLFEILQSDTLHLCEVAMGLCLDALSGLELLWAAAEDSDMGDLYSAGYEHFQDLLEGKMVPLSSEVQKGISVVLLQQPNRRHGSLPSTRTSLLQLLQKANISVKFFIGTRIPRIFESFGLHDHEALFGDVLKVLPSDEDWSEAIAFRLFVLAKLASKWPNLLRQAIYFLFETAGRLPHSTDHATRCLSDVSTILKVGKPQELFTLFTPQIMFTWLEEQNITATPFRIFGFSSLRELVKNAQEEVTALMVMRRMEDGVDEIARILELDASDLLRDCFPKAMAYAIGFDLYQKTTKEATSEALLRNRVGSGFFESVNLHFADIICILFNMLDSGLKIDKQFEKEGLTHALKILGDLKTLGFSEADLPANQQPFFPSRYLPRQIRHLCSRTQHEFDSLFTPALVATIARKLLGTINPALGSLHTCSVLRKVRVLLSFAGSIATEGYPLEMLLQSLQPLINNAECSTDAIGMIRYLMKNGSLYLLQVPSFVAGFGLSAMGSLKAFMASNKGNATEESQHQTTVSNVEAFQKWLSQYLRDYNSPILDSTSKESFRELVHCASSAQTIGNADLGTSESILLLRLIEDEHLGGNLLSQTSRNLGFSMLRSEFRGPTSFRNDILGDDSASVANAAVVWKSCRGSSSKEYLSWAARVLGRAFAASGHVHKELLLESTMSQITEISGSGEEYDSIPCVLRLLQELTLDPNLATAGLAEAALRFIVTSIDPDLAKLCEDNLSKALVDASNWAPFQIPPSESIECIENAVSLDEMLQPNSISQDRWLQNFSIALCQSLPGEPYLIALVPILRNVEGFAERVFPFLFHLVLSIFYQGDHAKRSALSKSYLNWFAFSDKANKNNLKILINSLLYLRTQPLPKEKSSAERSYWLEIDYPKAATAAISCGMFKTALLFVEESCTQPAKSSRRSSAVKDVLEQSDVPSEVLLLIFENIDDPDVYYGVQQKATLDTVLARFEYEKDGPKSLAFRGARYDSHIRKRDPHSADDVQHLVKALDVLDQNGLSHSLLQAQQTVGMTPASLDSMFRAARNLEQWDIPVPSTSDSDAVIIYKAFQSVFTAPDETKILEAVNDGFEYAMNRLVREDLNATALHSSLQTLAALVEIDEILSSRGSEQFEQLLSRFEKRSAWMKTGSFEDISQILSCRGTALNTLNQRARLQEIIDVKSLDTRLVQVKTALLSSKINRAHNALQESLSLATSMIDLIPPCNALGLNPEIAIHMEAAHALWEQGEMASSIGMLQGLDDASLFKKQKFIGRSNLLSLIGHRVSFARLEKADKIVEKYLDPALKELKGEVNGSEAGEVFHQFAKFCDQQLDDPDGLEDLERLQKLSKNKSDEVHEYERLIKKAQPNEKEKYKNYLKKAKNWLRLDNEELDRLNSNRDKLLQQCFHNYLLALGASDEHDSNALRFSALWLKHSEDKRANDAVKRHIGQVPSRKFASLMNQLTSRLQESNVLFQELLFSLIVRICIEHPFHGMYQIYAGANNRPNSQDESALSRRAATKKVEAKFKEVKSAGEIYNAIQVTNKCYCELAREKDEQNYKTGRKIPVNKSRGAINLYSWFKKTHIPPPTMSIDLAPDCNYSNLPHATGLEPVMTIASGVSLPKIITVTASNGVKYKQLVKGGNDDLRQDAIMEQVFEQVSELLKTNRSTRQRNLSIRTYRVLPLTNIAGVIEFVPDTMPLHDFIIPAHEAYHPKDLKASQCRKEISDVQGSSLDIRVKKFRSVTERFRPVMRYFFTERFKDPDTWFASRLAYTRSTAAISILGHVLGLGDRHGHNILLDKKSGEVVHIDLGVAFEMGRVLPVPELVPFRLTRDIVDGMGITKTDGVFRRCCEFTLEALRKEVYSIMTILDVLRYDPLYSWSITPVRLAKLQAGQNNETVGEVGGGADGMGVLEGKERKEKVNEPGEADRALTVVNKKLSKTLSVTATVNDLINQAGDERNLAVLYSGWAAYA